MSIVFHFVWNPTLFFFFVNSTTTVLLLFMCLFCLFLPTGAWETNSTACPKDPVVPLQRAQVPVGATQVMLDLPGMVTEGERDESPFYHNTHFDQCKNSTAGQMTTTSPHIRGGVNSTKST